MNKKYQKLVFLFSFLLVTITSSSAFTFKNYSTGDNIKVTKLKNIVIGGGTDLKACTGPISRRVVVGPSPAPCSLDSEFVTLKNQNGWSYNSSIDTHSIDMNVTAFNYPYGTYFTVFRLADGQVIEKEWKLDGGVSEPISIARPSIQLAITPATSTTSTLSLNSFNSLDCIDLKNNLRIRLSDSETGGEITKLQKSLIKLGYLNIIPTGYFGSKTQRAVKEFQKKQGIVSTGFVGTITREEISRLTCDDGSEVSDNGPISNIIIQNTTIITNNANNINATATNLSSSFAGVQNTSAITNLCPDGTPKPLVVVGPSTGCENHQSPNNLVSGFAGIQNVQINTNTNTAPTLLSSNYINTNFAENNTLYNNLPVYAKVINLNKSNPPKACIQLEGNSNCSTASSYRDYTEQEWLNNNSIQTVVPDPAQFPAVKYTSYIIYPNGSPIKVGSFTLALPVSAVGAFSEIGGYAWEVYTNLLGVEGWRYFASAGVNPPATACTESTNGRRETIRIVDKDYVFRCSPWYSR